jgi:hypothetical protein
MSRRAGHGPHALSPEPSRFILQPCDSAGAVCSVGIVINGRIVKISIGLLPRLLRRTAVRSLRVETDALHIEQAAGTTTIGLDAISAITVGPGPLWSTLLISVTDGTRPLVIPGVSRGAAGIFAAVVTACKTAPAIQRAVREFTDLCTRSGYLNFQAYQEWRQAHAGHAEGSGRSLEALPLPAELRPAVDRYLPWSAGASSWSGSETTCMPASNWASTVLSSTRWSASLTPRQREAIVYDEGNCLVVAGKAFKVAMIACMRKLVTILNVMVRNNEDWRVPVLQNP